VVINQGPHRKPLSSVLFATNLKFLARLNHSVPPRFRQRSAGGCDSRRSGLPRPSRSSHHSRPATDSAVWRSVYPPLGLCRPLRERPAELSGPTPAQSPCTRCPRPFFVSCPRPQQFPRRQTG